MERSRGLVGSLLQRYGPIAATIFLVYGCHHTPPRVPLYSPETQLWAVGTGGIAVTEEAHASRVAADILRAGGNAVDAAVAAAFALAVTYPEAGNIGGGGFLVAYDAESTSFWALDFRETAPAAAYRDMYIDLAAARKPDASRRGPLAAGIPGTPAGLHAAWERFGSMEWSELVRPAIALARGGFDVGERTAESYAKEWAGLRRFYATRRTFARRGAPPRVGSWLIQEDLAASLELIAREGARGFYTGALGRRLVEGVREAGGIWTADDLAGYRAVFRTPGRFALGAASPHSDGAADIEIVTMPPPSSGSLVLGQAVSFLDAQRAFEHSPDDAWRSIAVIEALRLAFADRNTRLADPVRMTVPADQLLDTDYLRRRAQLLPVDPPGDSSRIPGRYKGSESSNTTQIVVMDASGGVVSLTTTLNALFGCKFVVPGTGILLNNEMDDFDTRPGLPNMYGLVGSGANSVVPGARMLSSMSPTIVARNGRPWIALGARGGPRILSSVLQVIINRCIDGVGLVQAVSAPRIHHQWWPDEVFFERTDSRDALRASLEAMGYATATRDVVGRVVAAESLGHGRFLGVRDSRISGLALPVVPEE